VRRAVLIEGEVIRSGGTHERRGFFDNRVDRPYFPFSVVHTTHEALNVGVNVLVRRGTSRISGFAGGGLGINRATDDRISRTTCEPTACQLGPVVTRRIWWTVSGWLSHPPGTRGSAWTWRWRRASSHSGVRAG
jgi:hypothetical protein